MADTTTTTPTEPSMSELRAMIATTTQAETPAAQQQTSETTAAETATEEHTEAATETAEEHTNSETSDDDLPPGVKKRIAKEAEKAARIQSEIDRAVSDRKAKEAKLAQLKAETGAEPAQNTDKPVTSKRPEPGEPGHEKETYPEYEARRDEWLQTEAIRRFREQTEAETRQRTAREKWDSAVTKHGKDFPTLMESARALAPEGLQQAISSLDNWDGVAVHLAKHPDELRQLAGVYSQNPTRAIATLGRIEAALTKESDTATTPKPTKPLPEPLKKIGGTASASGEDLQKSLEGGNFAHFKAAMGKLRK